MENGTEEIKDIKFEQSQDRDQIFGALAAAQGNLIQPKKRKTAKVVLKGGGSYSYSYCDIADVLEACLKPFSTEGIAVMQYPTIETGFGEQRGVLVSVRTVLGHKSGQWVSCSISAMADGMGPQSLGSAITYLRRYGLQLIAGIAADEDEDGSIANGEQEESHNGKDEPKRASSNSIQAAPEASFFDDAISETSVKSGGVGKDAWIRHGIKTINNGWVSTFDPNIAAAAGKLKGSGFICRFNVKKDGNYINLISFSELDPDGNVTKHYEGK